MFDAKTRLLTPALAVIAAVALSGCEASQDGDPFPAPAPGTFNALFSLTTGDLPFPSDVPGFLGSTDQTLNYTGALNAAPLRLTGPSLNTLDGFSTSAHITTSFNQPIRAESISGSNIRMIELYLSNTTKAPASGAELPPGVASPVRRVLTFGTDFTAAVSDSPETGGRLLEITPLKPLTPSTGATNIGYLVVLTNGLTDIALRAAQPSEDYAAIKNATSCGSIANATLAALCPLYKGQLLIAQAVGIDPATVVLTWSFTTQSISDPFIALDATVTAQPIGVVPTGLTTQQVNAALPGKANLYVGTTVLPYYSAVPANVNDRTVLTSFWLAAGPPPAPLDQTSRFITRFNPLPAKRADVTVPLLVTVPNATAAGGAGCPKPTAGWPVVIVQHGITRDRTDALAMADSFADACFILAAIDLPFHGITNTTNALYQAANERTFNLDLVNNTTGAATPDGVIDTSGTHSISVLLSSPLTGRDSLRQGEADLGVLAKSLVNLDVTGDAQPDVDPARIHYVGLSLGGIVGVAQARFAPGVRTATVAAPGGLLTQLLLESPTFGPSVTRTIGTTFAASGLSAPANSVLFNNFFREVQTVADPGDPINHVCQCAQLKPLHLIKVLGDTVVPNSATDRLITAGNLRKLSTLGPNAVGPGQGAYVAFTQGDHGSLFDPRASLAATTEMQRQTVLFAVSAVQPGGPFVVITNPAVIQP